MNMLYSVHFKIVFNRVKSCLTLQNTSTEDLLYCSLSSIRHR